jgi:hypothetical protein
MLWSSRKKLGAKGLRCKIVICPHAAPSFVCNRPARRYACEKRGFDLGVIDCCSGHAKVHEKQGITMKLIDRRKVPA